MTLAHRFRLIHRRMARPGARQQLLTTLAYDHREECAALLAELGAQRLGDDEEEEVGLALTAIAAIVRHVDPAAWLQAAREAAGA